MHGTYNYKHFFILLKACWCFLIRVETCRVLETTYCFAVNSNFILGAFAKLWNATISFLMSVRQSMRPSSRMEQLVSPWTNFHEMWYFSAFRKTVEKIQFWWRYDKNNGYFTWRLLNIWSCLAKFFLRVRNISDKRCRGNQHKHIAFNKFFENRAVCEIMWNNIVEPGGLRRYFTYELHAG